MPTVKKEERYVDVAYELMCGFKRSAALADDVEKQMKDDEGLRGARDDTRGWDGDNMAVVVVTYRSLEDANRLNAEVRRLLGRRVEFSYEADHSISYGSRGPVSHVTSRTAILAS